MSAGIRECFIPREGWVFGNADYPQLELYCLAQICKTLFGHSKLAEALNAGRDAHVQLASTVTGKPYETLIAEGALTKGTPAYKERQACKHTNYGLGGYMGLPRFQSLLGEFGIHKSIEECGHYKASWHATWPETQDFFAWVKAQCPPRGSPKYLSNGAKNGARLVQLFTGRVRGGCTLPNGCNTMFQGLGTDIAQRAGWLITEAMYVQPQSYLYGSRLVNFLHDEFLPEILDDYYAHDAVMEMCRLMEVAANGFLPDVPLKVEGLLMRYWSKNAKALYDSNNRLIPWSE